MSAALSRLAAVLRAQDEIVRNLRCADPRGFGFAVGAYETLAAAVETLLRGDDQPAQGGAVLELTSAEVQALIGAFGPVEQQVALLEMVERQMGCTDPQCVTRKGLVHGRLLAGIKARLVASAGERLAAGIAADGTRASS